jgi:hypothetical protein
MSLIVMETSRITNPEAEVRSDLQPVQKNDDYKITGKACFNDAIKK